MAIHGTSTHGPRTPGAMVPRTDTHICPDRTPSQESCTLWNKEYIFQCEYEPLSPWYGPMSPCPNGLSGPRHMGAAVAHGPMSTRHPWLSMAHRHTGPGLQEPWSRGPIPISALIEHPARNLAPCGTRNTVSRPSGSPIHEVPQYWVTDKTEFKRIILNPRTEHTGQRELDKTSNWTPTVRTRQGADTEFVGMISEWY